MILVQGRPQSQHTLSLPVLQDCTFCRPPTQEAPPLALELVKRVENASLQNCCRVQLVAVIARKLKDPNPHLSGLESQQESTSFKVQRKDQGRFPKRRGWRVQQIHLGFTMWRGSDYQKNSMQNTTRDASCATRFYCFP